MAIFLFFIRFFSHCLLLVLLFERDDDAPFSFSFQADVEQEGFAYHIQGVLASVSTRRSYSANFLNFNFERATYTYKIKD